MPGKTHMIRIPDSVYVKLLAFQQPRESIAEVIGRLISNTEGIIKFIQQVKTSGAWGKYDSDGAAEQKPLTVAEKYRRGVEGK